MQKLQTIKPSHLLFIFVGLCLFIGVFVVPDYGRSTDESHESRTALLAQKMYTGEVNANQLESYEQLGHDRYYGTASTVTVSMIETYLFPDIDHSRKVVAHYVYFVFFQIAVIGLFFLARYFFNDWVSLGTALLFGTQPLLIGHAFINPKDIPILTTFLFTVVTGFSMIDKWKQESFSESQNANQKGINERQTLQKRLVYILFFLSFSSLWGKQWITSLLLRIVEYSYYTKGESLSGKLFEILTTFGSLEGYLTATRLYIVEVYNWIILGIPLVLILLFVYIQKHQLFGENINLFLLMAASIWGFAVSTRVISLVAGGMVGIYALLKFGRKSIFPLTLYVMTASMISFVFWPLVWVYGFRAYIESLSLYRNFPWLGEVLFEGQHYSPTELPARYLPKLMLFQFTEPMIILTLVGLLISFYFLFYKREFDFRKLLLVFIWFFLPLVYTMIGHPTVYSNFRHFLFIIPPLFIFAGFSLQYISSLWNNKVMTVIICLLLYAPGLGSIIKIHPFEYVYYNSFVDGVKGASNQYPLDYWRISYKNLMDYVNESIPPGSRILVWKDNLSGALYADHPYDFFAHTSVAEAEYQNFDFMLIPTDEYKEHTYFSRMPVVYSVDVDDVSLNVVLKLSP